MKIKTTQYIEDISVRIAIEDGPIRPLQFSDTGRRYEVDCLLIRFRRVDDLDWMVNQVQILGVKIRKDGSRSEQRYVESVFLFDQTRWPTWVSELVTLHYPKSLGSCAGTEHEMEIDADA